MLRRLSCLRIVRDPSQSLLGVSAACFSTKRPEETTMNVFDRKAKKLQKNRAMLNPEYKIFEYVKEEIGYRVADRIFDIKRQFNNVLDLGCGRGYVSKHITKDTVNNLFMCELADKVLEAADTPEDVPTVKLQVDEEFLPFQDNFFDLVVSSLSLHWVNDLPSCFRQVQACLKNDSAFVGALFGGETLFELRVSLQLAEMERLGGFSPHISPFTEVRDLGNLLTRAGFAMLTVDVDEMKIHYPSLFELMVDLKGMSENNCALNRKLSLNRDVLLAADAIYRERFGSPDGTVPATFHIINFIGWKPDKSQKGPAQRGSATVSLKDLDKINLLAKEKVKGETASDHTTVTIDDLDKLKDLALKKGVEGKGQGATITLDDIQKVDELLGKKPK